ncbi:MAG: acyl-CoA reductase [Bacteroidia bacterium]
MTVQQRTSAFVKLSKFLADFRLGKPEPKQQRFYTDLEKVIHASYIYNGWFTEENVRRALQGIERMLEEKSLNEFTAGINDPKKPKKVAVIMAGNIPAVGFHDLLCVLLSGHTVLIKVSGDDPALIPFLAGMLIYFEPGFAGRIEFAENRLSGFDAVIATGSNNSARYFEYYFGKYPNIIRRSRTSVALLTGDETTEELKLLGHDIFDYFGLGCRNVNKVLVPEGYVFDPLFEAVFDFGKVIDNKKYANNYEYNRAIYLLDSVKFLDNNFLMIKEDPGFSSPVSVLFYENYKNLAEAKEKLKQHAGEIQCVVAREEAVINSVSFGQSQCPGVSDFADNVNTLEFLNKL